MPATRIAIFATLFTFVALDAFAQAIDIPLISTSTRGPSTWMGAQFAHQFETNVNNSPAEMSRDSVQVSGGHRAEVSDDVFLIGNVAYHGTYYDFDKGSTPGTRLQWNDIHQVTLAFGVGFRLDENWTLVALGIGKSAGESGASFDDTLTGGGGVAIDYKWSDDLSTGLVIGVLSQLEDSAAIVPIPTVDWRFSEGWLLHFGLVGMAHPGVGPEVSWQADQFQLAFGGSFQKRRYRLDDRNNGLNEGIGEERSFPVFARAAWTPNENVNLGITTGVALGGEIRSGRESGGKIFKEKYKAAPLAGFQAMFKF